VIVTLSKSRQEQQLAMVSAAPALVRLRRPYVGHITATGGLWPSMAAPFDLFAGAAA
jgi:hypothetical protein